MEVEEVEEAPAGKRKRALLSGVQRWCLDVSEWDELSADQVRWKKCMMNNTGRQIGPEELDAAAPSLIACTNATLRYPTFYTTPPTTRHSRDVIVRVRWHTATAVHASAGFCCPLLCSALLCSTLADFAP